MKERLTNQKWSDDIDLTQEYGYSHIYKRLYDYEDLEEQGLIVRLPCKVGDKICKFNAHSNGDIWILEAKCLKIEINKKGTLFTFDKLASRYLEEGFFADINGEFIETDKYYVCDRAEAEARLKKLRGGV